MKKNLPASQDVSLDQGLTQTSEATGNVGEENDVGKWVGKSATMTAAQKREILQERWVPSTNYDFTENGIYQRRKFVFTWLNTYNPWNGSRTPEN